MIKIRLFCNQGMSTSLLVNKMKASAQEKNIEVDIAAYPASEMADRVKGIDCALLGPQVGYMKKVAEETCAAAGVPMDVIPMMDYGMCNGAKVLEFAIKLAGR